MNPTRLALAAALLLFSAAAVRATSTQAQQQREQLRKDAEAKRAAMKLDGAKAFASYPTPEMTFAGEPLQLAPGGSGTVALTGKYPADSNVVLNSEQVKFAGQNSSANRWELKLEAAKDALPADVSIAIIAPVSGAEEDLQIAQVRGKFDLAVKFEDGTQAAFHASSVDGLDEQGTIAWKEAGAKTAARSSRAEVKFEGGRVHVSVSPSDEEVAAATSAGQASLKIYQDPETQKQLQQISQRMGACVKVPQDQQTACIKEASAAAEAFQNELKKKMDAANASYKQARPKGDITCLEWNLSGTAGALSGEASCAEDAKMKISGSAKYVGPAK